MSQYDYDEYRRQYDSAPSPDAPTQANTAYEIHLPPASQPPRPPRNGNGGNNAAGGPNRWKWVALALLVVLIGGGTAIVINRSPTSSQAHTPTATTTLGNPTGTALPTATQHAALICPTSTPLPTGDKPVMVTDKASIDVFPFPWLPPQSVMAYFTSQDHEDTARIQHRTVHACTIGTAASVEGNYTTSFTTPWNACGTLCWSSTTGVITQMVQLANASATNSVTSYDLILALKATVTQPDENVPPGPIKFVASSSQADMKWDGAGTLQLASNTDTALGGCTATTLQFKDLQHLAYSHAQNTLTLTSGEATVGCLQTANGSFVVFSAAYTSGNSALTLSFTAYIQGFS